MKNLMRRVGQPPPPARHAQPGHRFATAWKRLAKPVGLPGTGALGGPERQGCDRRRRLVRPAMSSSLFAARTYWFWRRSRQVMKRPREGRLKSVALRGCPPPPLASTPSRLAIFAIAWKRLAQRVRLPATGPWASQKRQVWRAPRRLVRSAMLPSPFAARNLLVSATLAG